MDLFVGKVLGVLICGGEFLCDYCVDECVWDC